MCYHRAENEYSSLPVSRLICGKSLCAMFPIVLGFIFTLQVFSVTSFKNPNYVANRTTMVHLFEWKFNDIANECEEFLGPMGYAGVQVSPVHENVIVPHRPWYERYQPISYKIKSRSGDENDFKDMVRRCNNVGVRIYVDVIFNHMCADQNGPAIGVGGSIAFPQQRLYPAVPYNASDFHTLCSIPDYNHVREVRDCEIDGLHDLDQSRENVRDIIVNAMNELIDYGVAGFRIDAAIHMAPNDLEIIYNRLKNLSGEHGFQPGSKPYIFQEIIDMGDQAISKDEYGFAALIEFKFGVVLGQMFQGQRDLRWLNTWGLPNWNLGSSFETLVMIDNHDNQRGHGVKADILTYKKSQQYKMAVGFMLAHPFGNPRIMSSFHFDDPNVGPPADLEKNILSPIIENNICKNGWVCEHRWRQIFNMVQFRNVVNNAPLVNWWYGEKDQIAFSRGNRGFVAFNGNYNDMNRRIYTGLPAGTYCNVINGHFQNGNCSGQIVHVDESGFAEIEIASWAEDKFLAIHIEARL